MEIKNIIKVIAMIVLILISTIVIFILSSLFIKSIRELKSFSEIGDWIKILYPLAQIAIAIYFTRKGLKYFNKKN